MRGAPSQLAAGRGAPAAPRRTPAAAGPPLRPARGAALTPRRPARRAGARPAAYMTNGAPTKPWHELDVKHVVEAQQFKREALEVIFAEAAAMERVRPGTPEAKVLDGRVMATLFYEPSTRTRLSFESAITRLGGQVLSTESAGEYSSAAKGETLEDTIRTIEAYADCIVLRHFAAGSAARAAGVASVPIINAGDGPGQHPTQALLDLYSIQKEIGRLTDFKIGMVGDLLNGRTVHSLAYMLSMFPGVKVYFVAPPVVAMKADLKAFLTSKGVQWEEVDDLRAVASDVDVLYMTRIQKERFADMGAYAQARGKYIIDADLMRQLRPDAVVLHPLPRVDEIAVEVDADPRAAYFRQAKNGLYIRMALVKHLRSTQHAAGDGGAGGLAGPLRARASSAGALAAEGTAALQLRKYYTGLLDSAEARGSPCAELAALLAAGVQQPLAQAVASALALLAAPATQAAAAGRFGFVRTLDALCYMLERSFQIRKDLGAPRAELAAEVERAGVLPPLAAACTALAVALEAEEQQQQEGEQQQQQQQLQQEQQRRRRRRRQHELFDLRRLTVSALLRAAHAVSIAWPPQGQLEGPLLRKAQPVARLALAALRRAGAWCAQAASGAARVLLVDDALIDARLTAALTVRSLELAREAGRVSAEAQQALLSDPAVQQLLLADLALLAAHRHKAQRGRPASTGGGSGAGAGAPAVPAAHAALLRMLGLDAAAVPQGEDNEQLMEASISAVAMLFEVLPPTSCGAGGGLPAAGAVELAGAAAEAALELVALQPTPRPLAAGVICAGAVVDCLLRPVPGGAPGADQAAAAAVVRAFLPLARPTTAALLAPATGSSAGSSQAAAGLGGAQLQPVNAGLAEVALLRCGYLLLWSGGPEADAALAAFAQQDPSTLCRLLEASARSWAGRVAPQAALDAAHALCATIDWLGPSLAAAPALTATGGGAGLLLQREVFACLLTALKCVAAGAPLAAAALNRDEQLRDLASGCQVVVCTGCAIVDAVARAQPAAVAAAGGQLAYEPPALWAVLAARGVAVLAQLLSEALAAQPAAGAPTAGGGGGSGAPVWLAPAAAVLALRDAAALLGERLRALGPLPADASRAGLERLLAQQELLCTAAAELVAQLGDDAQADAAASVSTLQERGPALAAQAEELCAAVCAALPLRACCNNPRCTALAGVHSELAAVRGPACVCGGCVKLAAPARFCSRACQAAAWRAHKPVCRALAAGVVAAAREAE
ncbi:PYRB2 [Scenedesmus sp. PABB004]|nr:PYRB2 [Scenedesmus sp. PABB004]